MSRYIDEEKFLDNFNDEIEMGVSDCSEAVNNALNNTVTADVAPVIHAHWKRVEGAGNNRWRCSNCLGEPYYKDLGCAYDFNFKYCHWYSPDFSKYCPHCGARMDEEVK